MLWWTCRSTRSLSTYIQLFDWSLFRYIGLLSHTRMPSHNLLPLSKGVWSSIPFRFELSVFGVFAGIESTTSGQTVLRFDQLSYFYIVSDVVMLQNLGSKWGSLFHFQKRTRWILNGLDRTSTFLIQRKQNGLSKSDLTSCVRACVIHTYICICIHVYIHIHICRQIYRYSVY